MLIPNISNSKYMIFKIKESYLNHYHQLKLNLFNYNFSSHNVINCKSNVLQKVEEYKYLSITLNHN